jgi:predicted Zn-dependent protease
MPADERITNHTAYAAIPVRYAIERGAWAEAAALPPMTTPYKEAEAIVWFGRALGAARSGDSAGAKKDLTELTRLHQEIATTGDPYWAEQVGIQQAAASAWIALAEKQTGQAITAMQDAADREDRTEKNVAMENRLSPMRELLGELLLEAGKPTDALPQFEHSLTIVPNRVRSLDGAAHAAAQSGNRTLAVSYFKQLLTLTAKADADRPVLRAAREYVDANTG